MASRLQRDEWTEFMRQRAGELRGRILKLVQGLWAPVRRGLYALDAAVPTKCYVMIHLVASGLTLVTGGLCLTTILVGAFPHWFESFRLPLQDVRGVVGGQDAVFICSSTAGRVYKFDLDGEVLDWRQFRMRPISIARRDDAIVVGGQWPIEDAAFHPGDPARAAAAAVEHNRWGHPSLVVSRPEGTVRIELQPWYFTLVQTPWPGLVWIPVMIFFLIMTAWARERRRRG